MEEREYRHRCPTDEKGPGAPRLQPVKLEKAERWLLPLSLPKGQGPANALIVAR